jgi:hypothetical protein
MANPSDPKHPHPDDPNAAAKPPEPHPDSAEEVDLGEATSLRPPPQPKPPASPPRKPAVPTTRSEYDEDWSAIVKAPRDDEATLELGTEDLVEIDAPEDRSILNRAMPPQPSGPQKLSEPRPEDTGPTEVRSSSSSSSTSSSSPSQRRTAPPAPPPPPSAFRKTPRPDSSAEGRPGGSEPTSVLPAVPPAPPSPPPAPPAPPASKPPTLSDQPAELTVPYVPAEGEGPRPVLPGGSESDIDLGSLSSEPEDSLAADFAELGGESSRTGPAESDSGVDFAEQVIDEGSSSVRLGDYAGPTGDRPSGSGIDRIAEEVESGVDLPPAVVESVDEGDSENIPTSMVEKARSAAPEEPEDSAVDLGRDALPGDLESPAAVDLGMDVEEASGVDIVDEADERSGAAPPKKGTVPSIAMSGSGRAAEARREEEPADLEAPPDEPDSDDASTLPSLPPGVRRPAAIREEPAFADDEEDEEEPVAAAARPPARPAAPSPAKHWVSGGAVGTLVGATLCAGVLWGTGYLNPSSAPHVPPAGSQQPPADGRVAAAPDKAPADRQPGENPPAGKPPAIEEVLRDTLRSQAGPLNRDDPKLRQALDELAKAESAAGLYMQGFTAKLAGNREEARKIFEQGREKFQADPTYGRKFQAALDSLDLDAPAEPKQGGGRTPPAADDAGRVAALLLLTTLAQAAAEPEEAGYKFWQAAKAARAGQYAQAVDALQAARKAHQERRLKRLFQAQNPDSDPDEQIFLRCCDLIASYWKLQEQLKESGYGSVQALLDDAKLLQGLAAKLKTDKKGLEKRVDTLLAGSPAPPPTPKSDGKAEAELVAVRAELKAAQAAAEAAKKEAQDARKEAAAGQTAQMKAAQAAAETAKKEAQDARQEVTAARKAATEAQARATELAESRKQAEVKLAAAGDRLKAAQTQAEELAGQLNALATRLDAKPGDVVKKVEALLTLVKNQDPKGEIAGLLKQIAAYKAQVSQMRPPEELLNVWLQLDLGSKLDLWALWLQGPEAKELLAKVAQDARSVADDAQLKPDVRAGGRLVLGLAQWAQGQPAEARASLQAARQQTQNERLREYAERAEKALERADAFYLPRARELYESGQLQAALRVLNSGVAALPDDRGRLLALRSLVRLDQALGQGKEQLAARVAGARQDAQEAAAAGAKAEGNYAAGRVAEELGALPEAEKNYRQAYTLQPNFNRYQAALARVLVEQARALPAKSAAVPAPGGFRAALTPRLTAMALVSTLLVSDEKAAAPDPKLDEAIDLARKAVEGGDNEGYLLWGRALAKQGSASAGLQRYLEGLRKLGREKAPPRMKPEYAEGLEEILKAQPTGGGPIPVPTEIGQGMDPLLAEGYYAAGLGHYFAGEYAEAEKDFDEALKNFNLDARYLYYRGLSRWNQGKLQPAEADFREAAALEAQARPSTWAVNTSLERIQGPVRQQLNRFRP